MKKYYYILFTYINVFQINFAKRFIFLNFIKYIIINIITFFEKEKKNFSLPFNI